MKNTLDYYQSLHYQISLVQRDDDSYFATHPELPGCMAEGQSVAEAVAYLADAKEAWIETRLSGGYDVPEPAAEEEYSGKLLLRMSPRLHGGLSEAAAKEHVSINQLITSALSEYLSGMRLYEKISDRLNKMEEEMRSEISSVVPALRSRIR
jgi:antitoxin HicB